MLAFVLHHGHEPLVLDQPEDDLDSEWSYWQNVWAGRGNAASIKPIIPIAQGYNPGSMVMDGSEITRFYNALKADTHAQDDIVETDKMVLVVNRPVKLIINSRDVIHDVGLAHFRMKMDAVPGTPTTMWFTPLYTTKQMKEKTGNPDFVYEISCDQMCGKGHYTMRGIVDVVTQAEFDAWKLSQKSKYQTAVLDNIKTSAPAPADTAKQASVVTPANTVVKK